MRNGPSSSATSNTERSLSATAAAPTTRPASTNTAACCPLLRPDPSARPRLVQIRDNLIARIAEAESHRWLGEAEGLKVSLAGARATGRAPLYATGSSRQLPLGRRQRPRGRDVASIAVSGDRDRFEVEQGFPVRRQWSPPACRAGESSPEIGPLPVVPRHQPPGDPMPHKVGKG
jgi:hypothetical protein